MSASLSASAARPSLARHLMAAGFIAIVTWLVFSSCLGNQFTNWDDSGYVLNNALLRDVSPAGLRAIFTMPVMGNYHPLTILTYALDYNSAEFEPVRYHAVNLLLHVLATMLAYWLAVLLTGRMAAGVVTALLFGLHPMHAEPVAWVAGRKDLLMTVFYFGACIAHIYYTGQQGMRRWLLYALGLLLFAAALLSKAVAVTLPLALLLTDWLRHRPLRPALLLEKLPHLALALLLGIVAYRIQHTGGAMDIHKVDYTLLQRMALAAYAFCTYIWLALVPVGLRCLYPYPAADGGGLPLAVYGCLLIVPVLGWVLWYYGRRSRVVVAGSLFFAVTIALLLQLIPVGDAIVAERYAYLPYFGLMLMAGAGVSWCAARSRNWAYGAWAFVFIYCSALAYGSYSRVPDWYNATTLWRAELDVEPVRVPLAYNNLGFIYFDAWMATTEPGQKAMYADSAFYLFGRCVALQPSFSNAWQGMGVLLYSRGDMAASTQAFRNVIAYKPSPEAYGDLGNLLSVTGKSDSAIWAFSKAIAGAKGNYLPFLSRGREYKTAGRWEPAKADLDSAILLAPAAPEPYYLRSYYYAQQGNKARALQDVEQALSLGYPQVDTVYYAGLRAAAGK